MVQKSHLTVGLLVTVVLAALCVAPASARSPERPDGAQGKGKARVHLGKARKIGDRCTLRPRGRKQRQRPVSRRPACLPRPDADALYWGATIGPQLTGAQAPWDMSAVTKFEGLVGKQLSLVQFFQPFANCASSPCTPYNFPKTPLENVRQHGAIPVLSWSSQSIPSSVSEPDYQLADVIEGKYDDYIRGFATSAKSWGKPFFLRFNWEMNGNWFPWSEGVNGNQPGEYVAAWRHVHDIFTSVGATNATWTWCPNIDPGKTMLNLSSQYPGDEYVDWTCLDGYNWGTNPIQPGGWKSFDELYGSTYAEIVDQVAPGKPMMIGEIGSTESGGSKSQWISDALSRIASGYPKVRAMLWFDTVVEGMDWPIETSSAATTAFAEGIQHQAFRGNSFAALAPAVVQPPS